MFFGCKRVEWIRVAINNKNVIFQNVSNWYFYLFNSIFMQDKLAQCFDIFANFVSDFGKCVTQQLVAGKWQTIFFRKKLINFSVVWIIIPRKRCWNQWIFLKFISRNYARKWTNGCRIFLVRIQLIKNYSFSIFQNSTIIRQ